MSLFDKKYCDICGEKIKFMGNRKLDDGNLCKDCAAKLSPWFSERRHSTVEDIRAQLAYREENQARVAAFNTTRTIGEYYRIFLDEDRKQFCVAQSRDIRTGNPDILDFSQVTGCNLDIDEDRHELYRKDKEGKSISYNPPRYDYSYNFYVRLQVNHPWFDEMRFRINQSSVNIAYGSTIPGGQQPAMAARPGGASGHGVINAAMRGALGAIGATAVYNPANYPEYQRYVEMGSEIRDTILQVRATAREESAAANAPKTAVTCPHCGASVIPDPSGCCEFCGGALYG